MKNAFGRSRARRKPTINITSLIDVMFLLLIFFMVSSVFRDTVGLNITLPAAATADKQEEIPHEIFITSDGGITFDKQEGLTLEELESALGDLIADDPAARMALTADAQSAYEDFVAVIDIARKVGGDKLIIHTKITKPKDGTVENVE
jgi:biopolymer transport protein ExbD